MLHNFIKELHNSHKPMFVVSFNKDLPQPYRIKDDLYW